MLDKVEKNCTDRARGEISAYIDGELTPSREFELELHFAACRSCTAELNEQKQFLCSLNSTLKNEQEIELPADFAKHIVANAESSVSGVRRPRELYNAVFICVGLGLFVLFALGADASKLFGGFFGFAEQAAIAVGLLGRIVYSIFYGAVIVVRLVASALEGDFAIALGVAAVVIAMIYVSRKVNGMRGI
jgi:anti-sigma factor RsiW